MSKKYTKIEKSLKKYLSSNNKLIPLRQRYHGMGHTEIICQVRDGGFIKALVGGANGYDVEANYIEYNKLPLSNTKIYRTLNQAILS